ncbi:MAG: sulfatase-like hydrolase/transferase [Acidobacteria bacterium]|nr:sulfatase-like hydrolase/transferase [Acidobacteriota bacterium]
MTRRAFGAVAGGSLLSAAPPRRPNILHLMTDGQQWGTIAERSECRTPNLNRLAASGVLFERSYTPSALCCPARAMLVSGAYHWHNGVYNQVHSAPSVSRDMFPDVVTYPQQLRQAGYRQGHVGKWHASYLRTPLDFGYDEIALVSGCRPSLLTKLNNNPDRIELPPKDAVRVVPSRMARWPGSEPFVWWGYREGPEEATEEYARAEAAIRMMRRFAKGDQPWHVELHYNYPDLCVPLKSYLDRYDPRSIPIPNSFHDTFAGKPGLHRKESESWGPMTGDDYRQGRAHYYAYWEQVDAQLGRVLKALEETGQADNTIVVATTDHGSMACAHRMWFMGWLPYEECYRIPMIVRWPGVSRPGAKSSRLVQLHDLAHTYVNAAAAEPLPFADGRNLRPLLADPEGAAWTDEIMCAFYGGEFLYTQRITLTDRFKYVFNGFDFDEMYDLERDPEELQNVVDRTDYRMHVDDMRTRLYGMMSKFEDPYGDVGPRNSLGSRPNHWDAPRYLPRGKRIR